MARYNSTVTSVAAIVATAPSGANANALFANLNLTASASLKIRRVTLGVIAQTGAPTSQQVAVALVRTTARGTQTTTNTPGKLDPTAAASNAAVDIAWSVVPTPSAWTAPFIFQVAFNTQSGVDLPWELLEELAVQGSGNGMAFINLTNALPSNHSYTLALEWEE